MEITRGTKHFAYDYIIDQHLQVYLREASVQIKVVCKRINTSIK